MYEEGRGRRKWQLGMTVECSRTNWRIQPKENDQAVVEEQQEIEAEAKVADQVAVALPWVAYTFELKHNLALFFCERLGFQLHLLKVLAVLV